jgi:hypothetical protein
MTKTEQVEDGAKVHLSGYQRRDIEVVDYRMGELAGTGLWFRDGADPLPEGGYFSCLGAAQTFGCLSESPYPSLVARRLNLPVRNLGYGGAGPEFFLRQSQLHPLINRGRFAIIQVMSGRSQSNSLFAADGLEFLTRRADGRRIGGNAAYAEVLAGPQVLQRAGRAGRVVARMLARPRVRRLVAETRDAWVESYRGLVSKLSCPTVLLWFSTRSPDYHEDPRSVRGLFGEFPQLVTRAMVREVASLCTGYAECTTVRGSPQPLVSRFTGEPVSIDPVRDRPDLGGGTLWTHNRYYPSPEMHEDAAAAILHILATRQIK